MTGTTKLDEVRKNPERFTWGTVVAIHAIKNFTFVEYLESPKPGSGGFRARYFSIYINGNDTCRSTPSIEGAMLLAVALSTLGCGGQADHMAQACCKILEVK